MPTALAASSCDPTSASGWRTAAQCGSARRQSPPSLDVITGSPPASRARRLASDAQCDKNDAPRQPNEERLIAQARADLEPKMGVEVFAGSLAADARPGEADRIALISEALAIPAED